jgi:hypothetical protein
MDFNHLPILFIRLVFLLSLLTTLTSHSATMTWLRPMSFGIEVEGVEIVGGPELQVMQYLAERMPQYEHKFESYPLKRNWYLIQNPTDDDNVYCFYGASYKAERETWGYFSEPTTILMPYPIVSLKGALDKYSKNGSVSLKQLFSADLSTVLFDGAVNVWTEAVRTYSEDNSNFLKFNVGHANAENLSSSLLKSRRIDFAYVGSSFTLLRSLKTKLTQDTVFCVLKMQKA